MVADRNWSLHHLIKFNAQEKECHLVVVGEWNRRK